MSDVLLVVFALLALLFATLVVALRQPMRAALALIAHMICLAAIFAILGVHVVALFQVLIYVGAVMVFMVYTIMLLDDRDPAYRHVFSRIAAPSIVVAVLIAACLGLLVARGVPPAAAEAAAPFAFSAFAVEFIRHYWFHFELASVLLLVGIVSAWTVIREGR
ncbi:MAG: NADH-quinone oxidoreductase subunit J [Betaproteobacteria bacterium]